MKVVLVYLCATFTTSLLVRRSVTVSGGIPQIWGFRRQIGEEFGRVGESPMTQILPQTWGILMKIGERKLELNPLLHVKFGQHFVVYSTSNKERVRH